MRALTARKRRDVLEVAAAMRVPAYLILLELRRLEGELLPATPGHDGEMARKAAAVVLRRRMGRVLDALVEFSAAELPDIEEAEEELAAVGTRRDEL